MSQPVRPGKPAFPGCLGSCLVSSRFVYMRRQADPLADILVA